MNGLRGAVRGRSGLPTTRCQTTLEVPVRFHMKTSLPPTDDEIRYVRLARSLRAVAAALVVCGLVIAMFETSPPVQRVRPTDTQPEDARAYAVVEPHATMATAAPADKALVAAARDVDPGYVRPGRGNEHRG